MRLKLLLFSALLTLSSAPNTMNDKENDPYPQIDSQYISYDMKNFINKYFIFGMYDAGPFEPLCDITIPVYLRCNIPLIEDFKKGTLLIKIFLDEESNKYCYLDYHYLPDFKKGEIINYDLTFQSQDDGLDKYLLTEYFIDRPIYVCLQFSLMIRFTLFEYYFPLYPKQSKSIDILNHRTKPFVNENILVRNNSNSRNEEFLFSDYSDFVEVDQFSKMRFDYFKFKYKYDGEFKYSNAYILFDDKNKIFANLKRNSTNMVSLPIQLIQNEEEISIELKPLYVNPFTCEMDDDPVGKLTSYLFVKKGSEQFIEDYEFTIIVEGLGACQCNVSHTVEVIKNDSIINNSGKIGYQFERGLR